MGACCRMSARATETRVKVPRMGTGIHAAENFDAACRAFAAQEYPDALLDLNAKDGRSAPAAVSQACRYGMTKVGGRAGTVGCTTVAQVRAFVARFWPAVVGITDRERERAARKREAAA